MGKTIHDQMLDKGLVKPEDAPEARRAAERASRPPEVEKELPPPFDPPARGRIVRSGGGPAPGKGSTAK